MHLVNSQESQTTFIQPHFIKEISCEGLTSCEVAQSIGIRHDNLVTLIRKLQLEQEVPEIQERTETIEGSVTPRKVFLMSVEDAKFLVTQSSTKVGRAYCRFLINCESQMRDLQAKAASNPLAVAISQINSDPMAAYSAIEQVLAKAKEETQKRLEAERLAAYSQAALTSSQANTRQQTKLVHDLEAKLAQRDRKLSVRQWLSISGCGHVKSTTKIVELLEALGFEAEKLIIGDDKWPSKVFPKYAFDDNADRIKAIINQQ